MAVAKAVILPLIGLLELSYSILRRYHPHQRKCSVCPSCPENEPEEAARRSPPSLFIWNQERQLANIVSRRKEKLLDSPNSSESTESQLPPSTSFYKEVRLWLVVAGCGLFVVLLPPNQKITDLLGIRDAAMSSPS